jgi:outer membrane protein OmpA-like peptidoglycan-associated protein
LGAGFLLLEDHALMVGLESTGAVSLASTELRNTNAEALAMAKYRFLSDFEVGAGVGPGFTSGIGTPDVRGVLSLQYTPAATRVEDRDGDGIVDALDACPDAAGVASDDPKKNGCPLPADRDKDGIVDVDDACPDVPGVASDDPKNNGCPLPADRDKDGIVDADDACPDVAGVRSDDPKKNGCPPDKDGDGIVDAEDACPEVPGMKDADPKKNGCPKKAVVTESEIVILEQVQFDTGKSTIKPISDALLDSIAQVLKEHPELKRLEVQGHTDNRGNAAANKRLSEARAKAVAAALVKRGVEKQRLTSKGYGQTKPLDPENNEAAWGKNRRVQFIVVEKAANAPEVKTP